jgi:transposase
MGRKKNFNTKYSPEFKLSVIMDMRENHLSYTETARKYNLGGHPDIGKNYVKLWERRYLEEGAAGLYVERRGRKTKMDNPKKGRPRKKPLDKEIENDLIAENQRLKERNEYLEMEIEYLKKLDALVRAEAKQNGKKHK